MHKGRRDQLIILGLSLIVRLGTVTLITAPGYMDAAYYAAGAINLGRGNGFSGAYRARPRTPPARSPAAPARGRP